MAAAVEPEAAARGQLSGRIRPELIAPEEGGPAGELGGGQATPGGAP